MTYTQHSIKLGDLKVAEAGAVGGLKGTVRGLLMRLEVGLEIGPRDWVKLQTALDGAEAAHKAIVDHLCNPVELV